jgi:hypothetical protein
MAGRPPSEGGQGKSARRYRAAGAAADSTKAIGSALGVQPQGEVELEDALSPGTVEIKAAFQQFTSLADFVRPGQHCDATG